MTSTPTASKQAVRRRAARPAGPAKGSEAEPSAVRVQAPTAAPARATRPAAPPPRRPAHRRLVAVAALVFGFVAAAAVAAVVAVMGIQHRHAQAEQNRHQRFVDTATQRVVNMFSFTPDTISDSVNRFVNGTSGPLRDMLSQNNNVENLKGMFRDTHASSEAVINGAALEAIDGVSNNASVLVAVRVTVTDIDGVNKPS